MHRKYEQHKHKRIGMTATMLIMIKMTISLLVCVIYTYVECSAQSVYRIWGCARSSIHFFWFASHHLTLLFVNTKRTTHPNKRKNKRKHFTLDLRWQWCLMISISVGNSNILFSISSSLFYGIHSNLSIRGAKGDTSEIKSIETHIKSDNSMCPY